MNLDGPDNWLAKLCGWFFVRDYFWIATRLADLYGLIYGPRC